MELLIINLLLKLIDGVVVRQHKRLYQDFKQEQEVLVVYLKWLNPLVMVMQMI